MAIYYESLEQFKKRGGLKQSTITPQQLLPAVVAHMVRMDRKFSLTVQGRLPKAMNEMLEEVFDLCHLQQPFYTQHCASRKTRYQNISKNRVKIEFDFTYRMSRDDEKSVLQELTQICAACIKDTDTTLQKIVKIHDYIVHNFSYEMNTKGSPFTVSTFMKERKGVCMAYALLFQKMMELIQVQCYYVVGQAIGESGLGHAWNMVLLEGEWYHIDATWNDLGSRFENHSIRYQYLLKSDAAMRKDHTWDETHYPICKSTKYEALHMLYDVAIIDQKLYYPGVNKQLSQCDIHTLKKSTVHPIQVDQCVTINNVLYFIHIADEKSLYEWNPLTDVLNQISPKRVQTLKKSDKAIIVTYEDGEVYQLSETQEVVNSSTIEKEQIYGQHIPFIHFDQTFLAVYEGEQQSLSFNYESLFSVQINDSVKQLTVTIEFEPKRIVAQFSENRKPISFENEGQLIVNTELLKQFMPTLPEHIVQAKNVKIPFTKSFEKQLQEIN